MAGSGRRTFVPGEVLTASNVMSYLQDQAVMNFAGTAARGSAIGTAVSEGMVSYLQDTNSVEVYKTVGTAVAGWEPVNLAQSPNMVINGGFDIWQRGTATVSNIGNQVFHPDRWFAITDSVGTVNSSRVDISAQGIGSQYAWKLERSAGASNRWVAIHMAEGALSLVGKTVTFSFYLRKGSALTADVSYDISTRASKYGTSYDRASGTISNASISSSSFTRFSATFPITTATSSASADLFEIEINAVQAGNTNVFFEIAGVQLEVGSTATPFRRNANSIQGELAACQRYYYQLDAIGGLGQNMGMGYQTSTTVAQLALYIPVVMRSASPTVAYSGVEVTDDVSYNQSITGMSVRTGKSVGNIMGITITNGAGGAQYRPCFLRNTSAASYIAFSTEL